ncbi:MAG: gliding motility-associated C-terminal domain-containing protein [Saprospiraceae bacterium]|nr:gliding motility-associated C-terminal domain-containing protein [Saprospiraceae bacterium]
MAKTALLLPLVLAITANLYAQLPAPCGGSSETANSCQNACIYCNFDGLTGSTAFGDSDGGNDVDFCGTLENAQWIGFIAGSTSATFTANPFFCNDGNGVQIALYADCTSAPLKCNIGKENGGNTPVSVSVDNLNPGSNYYLLIDGYAGDLCNFTISVTPNDAVYEPPLGMVGPISGPTEACPGAVFPYFVAAVQGAGAYIWDGPPGTLVNGEPVPAVVLGPAGSLVDITIGDQSGPICVQAANSCKRNPPCASSLNITVLPDSYRPTLTMEKPQTLNCTNEPAELVVQVTPPANYAYRWVADSMGHIVSGADRLRVKVDSVGLYTLTATNTVNGCASTDSLEVVEPLIPNAATLDVRPITCHGERNGILQVSDVANGVGPYLYSIDNKPFNQDPQIRFLDPGDHTLTIQGSNGCEFDTVFTMPEPAELLVVLDPDTAIHLGQTIDLWRETVVNYPERVNEVLISPAELTEFLCEDCPYAPIYSFRYRVTVIDSNGCQATGDRTVTVTKERYVYIPNVFTPDNSSDGGNDIFTVFGGEDVEMVKLLRVYNRWGKAIFENRNFAPNDVLAGWNGRVSGDGINPAVFIYEAEVLFKDGETERFLGDVTVVR